MEIYSLDIFPKPDELTIQISETSRTTPHIKIGEGNTGITIYLVAAGWNWDSRALYRLAEQLAVAGRDLAAKAGQAQQVEDQEAV